MTRNGRRARIIELASARIRDGPRLRYQSISLTKDGDVRATLLDGTIVELHQNGNDELTEALIQPVARNPHVIVGDPSAYWRKVVTDSAPSEEGLEVRLEEKRVKQAQARELAQKAAQKAREKTGRTQ